MRTFYFDTKIKELNELLTRNPQEGLAIPGIGQVKSSNLIVRGSAGTGKSILCSFLAYNLHNQLTRTEADGKEELVLPFVFYFSFAQPAQGLRTYIDHILCPPKTATKPYPVIMSPRSIRGKQEAGGIESLRRHLLDSLVAIDSAHLHNSATWEEIKKRLEQCLSDLWKSEEWTFASMDSEKKLYETIKPPTKSDNKGNAIPIDAEDQIKLCPVIIIDPVNFFFDHRDSRMAIAAIFESFRILGWPLIMTLEDGGEEFSESHRQLMSHVEFEADVILRLNATRDSYVRRTIEVIKNRNSQPQFGLHLYRIESPLHSLWSIPSTWGDLPEKWGEILPTTRARGESTERNPVYILPDSDTTWLKNDKKLEANIENKTPSLLNAKGKHPGFLIFPSIHWYLSQCRNRDKEPEYIYKSGIEKLDAILQENPREKQSGGSKKRLLFPPDAFILVHGAKGGHKLTVAFNLLIAGLWDTRRKNKGTNLVKSRSRESTSNSVMLISLGEETRIQVDLIARTDENNKNIKEFIKGKGNVGGKIMLHEWKWKAKNAGQPKKGGDIRLIEVNFEPGYLSVEEFFWALNSLEEHFRPSRILIDDTAHLRMRFPELHKEEMLFPALISFTQSRRIMCIAIDVEGGEEFISHGLKASADYLINLNLVDAHKEKEGIAKYDVQGKVIGRQAWMNVTNVRGKNYSTDNLMVSVISEESKHTLRVAGKTKDSKSV